MRRHPAQGTKAKKVGSGGGSRETHHGRGVGKNTVGRAELKDELCPEGSE